MKFPDDLQYKITAYWDRESGGMVNAGKYHVEFDTPIIYGGKGKAPCPDQLFLASIAGCLMDTFLNFKKRLNVMTQDISIESEMDIRMHNPRGYRIEEIRIKIKVFASKDILLNHNCANYALDYCHITQSIKKALPLITDIEIIKV
jgi:uncharacterized OsmC-like protein